MIKTENEIRNDVKETLESFEHWSRRLINDIFTERYGKDFFDYKFENKEALIKKDILKTIEDRMKSNPQRFPRKIDAILMDDISYFLCKDDFYKQFFKDILMNSFSGQEEVRHRIALLTGIRNKLYHGNPISYREAEIAICYSHDFIDCYNNYYRKCGKEKEYNVPFFIKVTDSLGRCGYRNDNEYPVLSLGYDKISLRPGDLYKIWVDVDANFPDNFYNIEWYIGNQKQATGKEFSFSPTVEMVSSTILVECHLVTKRKWHKYSTYDDGFTVYLGEILPPVEDLY